MYEYDVFGQVTIWDAGTLDIVGESTVGNPYMFTGGGEGLGSSC